MVITISYPSTWEVEAGGSKIQSHPDSRRAWDHKARSGTNARQQCSRARPDVLAMSVNRLIPIHKACVLVVGRVIVHAQAGRIWNHWRDGLLSLCRIVSITLTELGRSI